MRNILLFSFLLTAIASFGQSNFNSQSKWSANKKELIFNVGVTQFLGDLGGRNTIGKDYSLADLDIKSTNINLGVGYRYRFHKFFATTTMLNLGMIRGSDAETKEPIRNLRNLSFRSPFVNLNQRIEFIAFSRETVGSRYKIKGVKGAKGHNEQLYFFTGIGIAYFNPQAQYQGSWTNLRPLNTEGQGLTDGPKKYLPVTATIPFGIGFRFGISEMWRLGIEAIYLKTFSDYIDDVSGSYYDPAILGSQFGAASAYLSNPSTQPQMFNPGSQRGDKEKDAVFYLNFTLAKNLTYKSLNYNVKNYKYKRSKF